MRVLFSPMISGWADSWLGGGRNKLVRVVSQTNLGVFDIITCQRHRLLGVGVQHHGVTLI